MFLHKIHILTWHQLQRHSGIIVQYPFIFTARNEVGARLCFYRCLWFCSQGGVPDTPSGSRHPLGADTPLGTDPPRSRHTPSWTRYTTPPADTPQDQVHPLEQTTPPGADMPPQSRHPPRADTPLSRHPPGRDTPQNQVHPPGLSTPPWD